LAKNPRNKPLDPLTGACDGLVAKHPSRTRFGTARQAGDLLPPSRLGIALLVLALAALPLSEAQPSIGLSGPSQTFQGNTGENVTSYIRVYNGGNRTGEYSISVTGNISSFVSLERESVEILPGENKKIRIYYSLPPMPCTLTGVIVVSLSGGQIVPAVSRSINVAVTTPMANRPPFLNITSPANGSVVRGRVVVRITFHDPDGDPVEVSIYIDGSKVSEGDEYAWKTSLWSNGIHTIVATASDGDLNTSTTIHVTIRNVTSTQRAIVFGSVVGAILLASLVLRRFLGRRDLKDDCETA